MLKRILIAAASLLLALPCSAEAQTYSKVVLIVVDTLRADHLPFYGYSKNTAPFLSTLMDKSLVFENAISTSSYTAPATASIHTALLPDEHGVVIGLNATKRLHKINPSYMLNRVPEESLTLAEYLKALGYATFAVTDNGNICEEMGFAQGYDHFVTFKNEGSDKVNGTALDWKDSIKSKEKYFLYLHYMDPHSPYESHSPWYDENAKGTKDKLIASYNSEINKVDAQIELLFKEFAWDKDTLIIFTSDHGEEFWEHGKTGHGKTLYREVVHVPLFFYGDKITGKRSKAIVSNADVPPSVATLIDGPEFEQKAGYSIAGINIIDDKPDDRAVFSNLHKETKKGKKARIDAFTDHQWKFIMSSDTSGEESKVKKRELFSTSKDLEEKKNAIKVHKELSRELEQRLSSRTKPLPDVKRELVPYSFQG